jgi:hypothetical protein
MGPEFYEADILAVPPQTHPVPALKLRIKIYDLRLGKLKGIYRYLTCILRVRLEPVQVVDDFKVGGVGVKGPACA